MPGRPALLVTGLPRSGTSWTGKMLEASGEVVYLNEPLNPRRPPRSPGVLDAPVQYRFQYISEQHDREWQRAYSDTLRLRYRYAAEVRSLRSAYQAGRMVKYAGGFGLGRLRGRRAMLDDPYALFSSRWLVQQMGVRAAVLVRDPVGLLGSWKNLGWRIDLAVLLDQTRLMQEQLEPWRDELERGAAGDWIDQMCALWNVAHRLVDRYRATTEGMRVWRYESLAAEPMDRFAELYGWLGLHWSPKAQQAVREATTSSSDAKGFSWSLKGGLSRTAFRPMDSSKAASIAPGRLSEDEVARVRAATADVLALFP